MSLFSVNGDRAVAFVLRHELMTQSRYSFLVLRMSDDVEGDMNRSQMGSLVE